MDKSLIWLLVDTIQSKEDAYTVLDMLDDEEDLLPETRRSIRKAIIERISEVENAY